MARLHFPLLLWPLGQDHLLGQLLGEERFFVDRDPGGIRRAASEWLQKEQRDAWVDEPEMTRPQLSFHTVPLQLAYRDDKTGRAFPLSRQTLIRVAAVHSEPSDKPVHSECFLPYLGQRFFYYDSKQLGSLIHHFTRDFLEDQPPEQALQYLMPVEPTLEVISISDRDDGKRRRKEHREIPEILRTTTEPYPPGAQARKSVGRWPKAAWERGDTVQRLTQSLLDTPDNLLLVGEPGVGKSTIAFEAIRGAVRLSKERGEDAALTFWRTTPQRLIGKAKYLGEWQAICDEVVEALQQVKGILVLTDTADALKAGGAAETSVASYLATYLAKGQLRILGEMTPRALEAAKGMLPAFVHHFEVLPIQELDLPTTTAVMKRYRAYAASNYAIDTRPDALDLAIQLVNRYIKYQRNPGKQVQLFTRVIRQAHHDKREQIDAPFVLQQFIQYTGLPPILLDDAQPLSKDTLLDYFRQRIKGQDPALEQLAGVIQTFKAGINDPAKPIATLLFAGPTGVGKTAAAKALAEYFFANGQTHDPLLRIDMSEFQHPAHIGRLIGYDNGRDGATPGKLIQHVRTKPFSVILLDEIEKAHHSLFDALLSLLDEGLLTDRLGRTADFRNTIIIMTTNLGVSSGTPIGFADNRTDQISIGDIKAFFRPEFFNRIDRVVTFDSLDRRTIEQIAERELGLLAQRPGVLQRGIGLRFSPRLIEEVARAGFSPKYGARPLQRAIERLVVPVLTDWLLGDGPADVLWVDWRDGRVEVRAG